MFTYIKRPNLKVHNFCVDSIVQELRARIEVVLIEFITIPLNFKTAGKQMK